ncbi:MAG: hemolysin family protein [Syntrophales bacterium]
MDSYISFKLVFLVFLFAISGFLASSEAALFSLTPLHLHKMREERYPFLAAVQRLLEFPRRLLITIVVSNEIANILMSTVMAGLFIQILGDGGKWAAIAVMTPLLLVFGETIPKTLARTNPMKFSSAVSPVLSVLSRLEYPIVWGLEKISRWALGPLGRAKGGEPEGLMEHEFKTLVDIGVEEGVLEKSQRDLIHRVFELADMDVSDIMTPRVDMFCLPLSLGVEEIKKEIVKYGYSRIPIYENDRDNIIGILYSKDLLAGLTINGRIADIRSLLRKPYFVPLEKRADSLFKDFQTKKIHMAIVVDEYGGIAGLVTMEDILESLFGDIYDERDTRERLCRRIDQQTFIVSGMMPVDDFNELFGMSLSSEDYGTVGGYVLHLFGKLPGRGEEIAAGDYVFRIEKMSKARIMRIRVKKKEKTNAG